MAFTTEDIQRMTPRERAAAIALVRQAPIWRPLKGPQTDALESLADIVGYGGAAGGGKTDLIAGASITRHKRVLILRREKAQTDGIVQRMVEIVGSTNGYNGQKSAWRIPVGTQPLVEFGGLDNPGDERRWQGRPHDLKAFDEATEQREQQVRFVMGWTRTNDPALRARVLMTFNPPMSAEGLWVVRFFAPWLDPNHPKPAAPGELRWFTTIGDNPDYEVPDGRPFVVREDGSFDYAFDPAAHTPEEIIQPKSRTFIPARLTDNPYYMRTGYISQLQALPDAQRRAMLYGDFMSVMADDAFAMFPSAWIDAAMARWRQPEKLPTMDSVGVDVARGGADKTVIICRHGQWYAQPIAHPGLATPDGPTTGALAMAAARDGARLHVDAIGVGSSPVDWLRERDQPVIAVNVAESPTQMSQSGAFGFANLRTQLMWKLREALDPKNNTGICLPPSRELRADMTAVTWEMRGKVIQALSREKIIERRGRSPDYLSALMLASMDSPDLRALAAAIARPGAQREYNPLDFEMPRHGGSREYNPLSI